MKNINDLLNENTNSQRNLGGNFGNVNDVGDHANSDANTNEYHANNKRKEKGPARNDSQAKRSDSGGEMRKGTENVELNKKSGNTGSVEEELSEKMSEYRQKEFEEELKNKAGQLGVGYVNLKGVPVPAEVLQKISLEEVKSQQVCCFYFIPHQKARLATIKIEPTQIAELKEKYAEKLKVDIEMFVCSEESMAEILKQYEAVPKITETPREVEIGAADLEKFSDKIKSLQDIDELIKETSTTELVSLIVAAGLKAKASDIHIEAEAEGIKLRYRIDGVLNTAAVLSSEVWAKLISRLKLLAGLKLNVTDTPQDGRFSIFLADDKVDVRVSMLPTNYGESVVMRLLISRAAALTLDDLGLEKEYFELLSKQITRPNGMIVTTGPTGSGKTTTLYAMLNKLNSPDVKIITIEDPIEYELEGINQSQVEPKKDYTFAKGLKSIVRQDPDVIMVGEMRDLETVDIGLNAALTGHLVLSTLHTNNAAGAIPRFLAMGAKPYLLAPALDLIIAQRLIRKLCDKCKVETHLSDEEKNKLREVLGDLIERKKINLDEAKIYKVKGCEECNMIGYQGRVGIFEMFAMNKEIEDNILSGEVSEHKIKEVALKNGMITLQQDGMLKVLQGKTSLDEVGRVMGK